MDMNTHSHNGPIFSLSENDVGQLFDLWMCHLSANYRNQCEVSCTMCTVNITKDILVGYFRFLHVMHFCCNLCSQYFRYKLQTRHEVYRLTCPSITVGKCCWTNRMRISLQRHTHSLIADGAFNSSVSILA